MMTREAIRRTVMKTMTTSEGGQTEAEGRRTTGTGTATETVIGTINGRQGRAIAVATTVRGTMTDTIGTRVCDSIFIKKAIFRLERGESSKGCANLNFEKSGINFP